MYVNTGVCVDFESNKSRAGGRVRVEETFLSLAISASRDNLYMKYERRCVLKERERELERKEEGMERERDVVEPHGTLVIDSQFYRFTSHSLVSQARPSYEKIERAWSKAYTTRVAAHCTVRANHVQNSCHVTCTGMSLIGLKVHAFGDCDRECTWLV